MFKASSREENRSHPSLQPELPIAWLFAPSLLLEEALKATQTPHVPLLLPSLPSLLHAKLPRALVLHQTGVELVYHGPSLCLLL